MSESNIEGRQSAFNTADITALSHLYRGELYRSTVWRTRLDTTTNWAVLTTGIALSLTFSSESASPLPLVLVGLLVATFLYIEARRYRFFVGACVRMFSRCISSVQFFVAMASRSRMVGTRFSTRITEPPTFILAILKPWAAGSATTTAGFSRSR
jgi:uncharacterized membrane protein